MTSDHCGTYLHAPILNGSCLLQGRSHVSKIVLVQSFLPVSTNVQPQQSKGVEGREIGRGVPSPADWGIRGSVANSPSGSPPAANDFGAFHAQFYESSRIIFGAFNSCLEMRDSHIPLLVSRCDVPI